MRFPVSFFLLVWQEKVEEIVGSQMEVCRDDRCRFLAASAAFVATYLIATLACLSALVVSSKQEEVKVASFSRTDMEPMACAWQCAHARPKWQPRSKCKSKAKAKAKPKVVSSADCCGFALRLAMRARRLPSSACGKTCQRSMARHKWQGGNEIR